MSWTPPGGMPSQSGRVRARRASSSANRGSDLDPPIRGGSDHSQDIRPGQRREDQLAPLPLLPGLNSRITKNRVW